MNENNGYLKLARSIVEDEVWCDSDMLKLWFLCLTKARYKNGSTLMNGKKVELAIGQFITGRESLCKDFNKGVKKKKKVSESTLWNWLKKFESDEKLNIKTTNKYSIVTVVNWDKYQNEKEVLTSVEQQLDNDLTSTEQQLDITLTQKKKGKKEKKENKVKKGKNIHGTFSNVLLTSLEYEKIKFLKLLDILENLSNYIESTGKKYQSHYATILSWGKKDNKYSVKDMERMQKHFDKSSTADAEVEDDSMSEEERQAILDEIEEQKKQLGGR